MFFGLRGFKISYPVLRTGLCCFVVLALTRIVRDRDMFKLTEGTFLLARGIFLTRSREVFLLDFLFRMVFLCGLLLWLLVVGCSIGFLFAIRIFLVLLVVGCFYLSIVLVFLLRCLVLRVGCRVVRVLCSCICGL